MVTFAVTLTDLIEKGGAYAGIAAFFGLAVLAVLFFAQARELKRLREWAGRAPERAQELEQRVVEQAEAARRVRAEPQAQPFRRPGEPATVAAQQAAAAPPDGAAAVLADAAAPDAAQTPAEGEEAPAEDSAQEADEGTAIEHLVIPAAGEGEAAEGTPVSPSDDDDDEDAGESAAPAAAEDAEGAGEPAEVERDPVPAASAPAVATAGASAGAAAPSPTAVPAQVTPAPGNGTAAAGDIPALPPRATPAHALRRPAPAPAPAAALRTGTPSTRRPPPRRYVEPEPKAQAGGRRTGVIVVAAVAGVILIVVAILSFGGNGGGTHNTAKQTPTAPSPSVTRSTSGGSRPPRPAVPSRGETTVAVLNGTTIAGLAGSVNTRLQQAGFRKGPTPTNYTDQARSASVVFYASSVYRTRAKEAASLLDVSEIQPIIDSARQLAPGADVVVVVGADQSP